MENTNGSTFPSVVVDHTTHANVYDEESELDVALIVFRLLVCIIGVIGNLLVIFVILILREYKKAVTHWYVLQLAIADSVFLLTIPFKVSEELHNEWIYSAGMCKAKETVLFLNYYSSIIFLMIMSIDRYIAICHGFSDTLQKLRTQRAAFIITVVAWIVSLVMCTPIIMYSNKMGIAPNCKCRYLIPKPLKTPEEICREEGFTGSLFETCLEWTAPEKEKNLCSSLSEIGAHGSGGNGAYADIEHGVDTELSGMIYGEDGSFGEEESTTHQEGGGPSHILAMDCHYLNHGKGWTAMLAFNFAAMFLVPLIVMSVCYVLIVLRLTKTRNRTNSVNAPSHVSVTSTSGVTPGSGRKKRKVSIATLKADRNRNRVTVMCACLVLLFLACWLPFHAVHLAKLVGISGKTSEHCMKISAVASLIAYINSALNPFLYNFLGTRFGRRLRQVRESKTAKSFLSIAGRSKSDDNRNHSGGYHSSVSEKRKHQKSVVEKGVDNIIDADQLMHATNVSYKADENEAMLRKHADDNVSAPPAYSFSVYTGPEGEISFLHYRSAASSVRESVKKRTSSVTSSETVRYQPKKQLTDGGSSSQNGTVITKIYKGQEVNTADLSSGNDVFPDDSKKPEEQERLFSSNQV